MKIVGADGMDANAIRDEVGRGARFVVYAYCVSILVMTFRRPSNIHYIKPGEGRLVKGLPYALISLVAGWWGFPWGPIYTLQALVDNLLGGRDVTDEVLATLAPAAPGAAASPAPPAAGPARTQAPVVVKIAVGAAIVGVIAAAVVSSICLYQSRHLTVVLVGGSPVAYGVEFGGARYQLHQGRPIVLTVPEGRYTLTGGPRGAANPPRTFEFSRPFFDHLAGSQVAVVNPDRAAILYVEQTAYYVKGTKPDPNAHRVQTIYANDASYFLTRPDHVLAEFPEKIDMPGGTASATRTRLAVLTEGTIAERAAWLSAQRDYPTMRDHLMVLAALEPDDEALLGAAFASLKPGDCRALLESHLADRPVRVEWHRYYQTFAEIHFPDTDLNARYRALVAAEPGNGALAYLLGRVCAGRAERTRLYQKALAAPTPCYFAHAGLGADALNAGEFARAREQYDAAEQTGVKTASIAHGRRLARLAAGDFKALLAEAAARRAAAPEDLAAADEEITCALLAGRGSGAAERIKSEYLAAARRAHPGDTAELEKLSAFLSGVIAYGSGDAAASARAVEKLDSPLFVFQAAIDRCDHAAAAAALKKVPNASYSERLLCYLAAVIAGDQAAAAASFSGAVEAMAGGDSDVRRLGAMLRKPAPPAIADVNELILAPGEKSTVMAALGWHDPANREAYFAWARRMNFDPAFPHLLIERATQGSVTGI